MERHLSTGVATIVALMAANRAASARADAAPAYGQGATSWIEDCLRGILGVLGSQTASAETGSLPADGVQPNR